MEKIILEFPKHIEKGLDSAKNLKIKGNFKNAIICGMGGSALPGELLKILAEKIPIRIHRNYGAPAFADEKSLIVPISYSGNTEETLDAFEKSLKNGYSIAAVTSGGELEKLCREHNIPVAVVPSGIIPRMALCYQFSALIGILSRTKIISNNIEKELADFSKKWNPATSKKTGENLAEKIVGKIPLIYSSEKYEGLAYLFKFLLNENSKSHAFWNRFPELDHNEIQAFLSKKLDFMVLILKIAEENPRIIKRMQVTADMIRSKGNEVETVEIAGENIFEKMFNSLSVFYWTSFFLAEKLNVNPSENKIIEELKERLRG